MGGNETLSFVERDFPSALVWTRQEMHGGDDSCLGPKGGSSKENLFQEINIAHRIEIQNFYITAFSFAIICGEFVPDCIRKSGKFFSRIYSRLHIRHNNSSPYHNAFIILLYVCFLGNYSIVWLDIYDVKWPI